MQYAFFAKGICSVEQGLGKSCRSWRIFENCCVKSKLTVCKVTFDSVSYRKKLQEQDVLVASAIILSQLPQFPHLCMYERCNAPMVFYTVMRGGTNCNGTRVWSMVWSFVWIYGMAAILKVWSLVKATRQSMHIYTKDIGSRSWHISSRSCL